MIKTPGIHCRGHGFYPWLGKFHMPHNMAKKRPLDSKQFFEIYILIKDNGFPWWLSGKESPLQCRRCGLKSQVRKIPGGGNGSPLQYSCLENPMDRRAWWATVHGVTKSQTRLKWPSTQAKMMELLNVWCQQQRTQHPLNFPLPTRTPFPPILL